MTTADWALIISCGSLVISLAGFVWNVWSKFIFPKPRLRVHIGISSFFPNPDNYPDVISLIATNWGPSEITLHSAIAKKHGFWRNKLALINPLKSQPWSFNRDSDGPFSGGLPKKLSVGESFTSYFPVAKNWLKEDLVQFGFSDTFGRKHWCSKRNGKRLMKNLANHEGE